MIEILLAVLGVSGILLGLVLGQRFERRKQSLVIRAEMLEKVKEWLRGVEKFIGILMDTLGSITLPSPVPLTYDFEERRKSAQFMIEKTNEVLGILESESLKIRRTKADVKKLWSLIENLDNLVKYELLPLDHEILDRARKQNLDEAFIKEVGEFKLSLERQVKQAYSLISRIATKYN